MEKQVSKTERIRKAYAPKGERAQKMFTFRLDIDNADWLSQQHNKGRYINELIATDREKRKDNNI